MKKFITSFLMTMLIVLGTSASADKIEVGIFTLETVSSSTAILTDCDDSNYVGTTITSLSVPDTLSGYTIIGIGEYAFYDCEKITNVELPSTITTLETHSLAGLKSVTLGKKVQTIFEGAFSYPRGGAGVRLSTITLNSSNPYFVMQNGVLYNKSKTKLIYAASPADNFTVPSTVTAISAYAFSHGNITPRNTIQKITIPSSVKTIGDDAFLNCDDLTTVTFSGTGLTTIGEEAFFGCSALTTLNLPSTLTSIGDSAFTYCSSLKSIDLPDGLIRINSYMFESCTKLSSVDFPASLLSIDTGAFYSCTSLSSVSLPNSLKQIKSSAFYNCSSLTDIVIPDSVGTIDGYVFKYCTSLKNVTFPKNVSSFGTYIFSDCTALESVTLPENLTVLNYGTFYKCSALKEVSLPGTITSINGSSFRECANLSTIYFGASKSVWDSVTIGDYNTPLSSAEILCLTKLTFVESDTAEPYTIGFYSGEEIAAPEARTSKTGTVFLGWTTVQGSTTVEYAVGASLSALTTDTTLYGISDKQVYTTTTSSYGYFMITPIGVPTGSTIVLAAYRDNTLVFVRYVTYSGGTIPCQVSGDYDTIKVFAWSNAMKPLSLPELPEL